MSLNPAPELSGLEGGSDQVSDPCLAIEQAAVRLLAAREHSRAELKRKLRGRGYSDEYIDLTLDQLAAQGLQSDQRFAEQYFRLRLDRGYGPLRIRAEFEERGLAGELISSTLEAMDGHDWVDQLRAVAAGKFGNEPAADRREQGRRARFLAARGFPESMVRSYLLDR